MRGLSNSGSTPLLNPLGANAAQPPAAAHAMSLAKHPIAGGAGTAPRAIYHLANTND